MSKCNVEMSYTDVQVGTAITQWMDILYYRLHITECDDYYA